MAIIYFIERVQPNQQKEKPHEASPRKPGLNFQDISLSGVTQEALNSSSNELWRVWNVYQRLNAQGFYWGMLI